MTITRPITFTKLKTEYGVTYNSLSQYYGIPSQPNDIPASGTIRLGNFDGRSKPIVAKPVFTIALQYFFDTPVSYDVESGSTQTINNVWYTDAEVKSANALATIGYRNFYYNYSGVETWVEGAISVRSGQGKIRFVPSGAVQVKSIYMQAI